MATSKKPYRHVIKLFNFVRTACSSRHHIQSNVHTDVKVAQATCVLTFMHSMCPSSGQAQAINMGLPSRKQMSIPSNADAIRGSKVFGSFILLNSLFSSFFKKHHIKRGQGCVVIQCYLKKGDLLFAGTAIHIIHFRLIAAKLCSQFA